MMRRKRRRQDAAAREAYLHRDDPGEWGGEKVDLHLKPGQSTVVSFRLPVDEFLELEETTAHTGETVSEFIREALATRLRGRATAPTVEISGEVARMFVFHMANVLVKVRLTENPVPPTSVKEVMISPQGVTKQTNLFPLGRLYSAYH